jgi:N-acetylglucosaminyldiphosphoundecaprenol N-acetyl-beta-D-mannosaminyltransferase
MTPEKIKLKNISLSKLNKSETMRELENNNFTESKYICIVNVHSMISADTSLNLRDSINTAWIALADGKPLSVLANILGCKPKISRVTGPDLMHEVLKISAEYSWSHYFYGSTQKVLDDMKNTIEHRYEEIECEYFSPPFEKMNELDIKNHIYSINALGPNFIWIGLGAPKQEIFMKKYVSLFEHGVLIGVGAAFDFMAGHIKRAPSWMQNTSLEWLYRLIQDPVRLWKRYLVTNIKFIVFSIISIFKKRIY